MSMFLSLCAAPSCERSKVSASLNRSHFPRALLQAEYDFEGSERPRLRRRRTGVHQQGVLPDLVEVADPQPPVGLHHHAENFDDINLSLHVEQRPGVDLDAGPLAAARYLEPFAMTWIHLAYRQGFGRKFAFSIIRR